jgi:hypothetical protein
MAQQNAPYAYPTSAMIDDYTRALNQPAGGRQTSIDVASMGAPMVAPRGLMQRFRTWLGIAIAGANSGLVLFPPQQPLQPIAQAPEQFGIGRQWDYPVGYNMRVTPRSGSPITFEMLKNMSSYSMLATMINRVKDKVVSQQWNIRPKDKRAEADDRCKIATDFFASPDKDHSFDEWIRMLLDQVIVYDAPAIYLRPTRGGELYSMEILDGSKISPKIGPDGRVPTPELGPGYQQVLKGLPAVDYVKPVPRGMKVPTDPAGMPFPELLYKPRNPRVDSVYGFGPVEQVITIINIALRREEYFAGYYTHGSTPDLLLSVPKEWNPDQIAKFQIWFDGLLLGNLQTRRGARFVPDGVKIIDTKERVLTDQTDEWLTRIMCYALGLNPMPFLKMMNKGQEKTHHDEAMAEGFEPWLEWTASLFTWTLAFKFGWRDLAFMWAEDEETDELQRAQIEKLHVDGKIYHPDEIRAKRGDEPMPAAMREQMDMANFSSSANATVLPPEQQADEDARNQAMAAATPAPGEPAAGGGAAAKLGKLHGASRRYRAIARHY